MADLSYTDFEKANLTYASFHSPLGGTYFNEAIIEGTDFADAELNSEGYPDFLIEPDEEYDWGTD